MTLPQYRIPILDPDKIDAEFLPDAASALTVADNGDGTSTLSWSAGITATDNGDTTTLAWS